MSWSLMGVKGLNISYNFISTYFRPLDESQMTRNISLFFNSRRGKRTLRRRKAALLSRRQVRYL